MFGGRNVSGKRRYSARISSLPPYGMRRYKRTRKIRARIVLDIEGLALSAPIAGILELKAGAGQARGGLNRRGTCRADRSKEPKTKTNCGHGSQRFLFASQGCSRQSHRTAPPLDPA